MQNKKKLILPLLLLALISLSVGIFAVVGRSGETVDNRELVTVRAQASHGEVVGTGEYRVGDQVRLEFVPSENYRFAGWIDLETSEREFVSDQNPLIFTARKSVDLEAVGIIKTQYAIWLHTPIYVSEDVTKDFVVMFGAAEAGNFNWIGTLPTSQPNYTYDAHYLDSDYTTKLTPANLATHLGSLPGNILHVYANFIPIKHTIYYDTKGGDAIASTLHLQGSTITLPTTATRTHDNPTVKAWDFEGWFLEEDCADETSGHTDPCVPVTVISNIAGDVTVFAKWSERIITLHQVTWTVDGTTTQTDPNVVYGTVLTYNEAEPTKDSTAQYDYAFDGWSTDGTTVISETEGWNTIIDDTDFIAVFTATERKYSVVIYGTEDKSGDPIYEEDDVLYSAMPKNEAAVITLLDNEGIADPEKDYDEDYRYEFEEWDVTVDSTSGIVEVVPVFTAVDLELYVVTFHVLTVEVPVVVKELHLPALPTFELTDAYFAGLYSDPSCTVEFTASDWAAINGDIDLYVKFSDTPLIPEIEEIISSLEVALAIDDLVLPPVSTVGLVGIEILSGPSARRMAHQNVDDKTIRVTYVDSEAASNAYENYELGSEYNENGIKIDSMSHKVEILYDAGNSLTYFEIVVTKIEPIPVTSVTLYAEGAPLNDDITLEVGDSLDLEAIINPNDAEIYSIVWSATNDGTVVDFIYDENEASLEVLTAGSTTVTVTVNGDVFDSVNITCEEPTVLGQTSTFTTIANGSSDFAGASYPMQTVDGLEYTGDKFTTYVKASPSSNTKFRLGSGSAVGSLTIQVPTGVNAVIVGIEVEIAWYSTSGDAGTTSSIKYSTSNSGTINYNALAGSTYTPTGSFVNQSYNLSGLDAKSIQISTSAKRVEYNNLIVTYILL